MRWSASGLKAGSRRDPRLEVCRTDAPAGPADPVARGAADRASRTVRVGPMTTTATEAGGGRGATGRRGATAGAVGSFGVVSECGPHGGGKLGQHAWDRYVQRCANR